MSIYKVTVGVMKEAWNYSSPPSPSDEWKDLWVKVVLHVFPFTLWFLGHEPFMDVCPIIAASLSWAVSF